MGASLDARELNALYRQHGPMVYRRALRILGNHDDASEALQEVFIRVMRSADGFEQRSQVTTWLYRITTNYCLNFLRDRKRRKALLDANAARGEEPGNSAARPFEAVLFRRLLADADEREAQAALYVYVDGMSHEEAAELLGVSRRTVGNLLERFQAWAEERMRPRAEPGTPGGRP